MEIQEAVGMVKGQVKFLNTIVGQFESGQSQYKPEQNMLTVAQQVNHTAMTMDWFTEGAFGAGFDMNFEKIELQNRADVTLDEAKVRLEEATARAIAAIEKSGEEGLNALMPDNPIFGAIPRWHALIAMGDHTAHHRGALTVYLRMLGITPNMVYAD